MASTIAAGTTSGTAIAIAGDTSGVLQLQTNGTTAAVTIDTSQNVGIGTASPSVKFEVAGGAKLTGGNLSVTPSTTTNVALTICTNGGGTFFAGLDSSTGGSFGVGNYSSVLYNGANTPMVFFTNATERMRIDSSGTLYLRATSGTAWTATNGTFAQLGDSTFPITGTSPSIVAIFNRNTNTGTVVEMKYNGALVGTIATNGSNCTFNSVSDYRLKENIAPMTSALATVAQLKPVTYKWKLDGSDSQGFIAHELAEVVPECVTGEKDAVDKNGKPVYQGIDTSFLVATLTAAIQELKAEVDSLKQQLGK